MTAERRLTECPVCRSVRVSPRFRMAFPTHGPNGRVAWPLGKVPPVPHWIIDRCASCGLHFANPLPHPETIEGFYAGQQEPNAWEMLNYVEATADRVAYWSRFAEKLTRLAGEPGRLLEIGPAAGHLLRAAREQGWAVMGVEAAPKFSQIIRRQGLPVHDGTLATLDSDDGVYDVIVMIDVLEHLPDPISDLAHCRRLLRPRGHLVVATCDIGSLAARYYGLRWRQLVLSHTFYWTERSLSLALEQAGLRVSQTAGVRWWDPDHMRQRREWVVEFRKLVARKILQKTWMPLARRSGSARDFQQRLTHGRLDLRALEHKVGDQAVMSEVILVVAVPSGK